MDGAKVKIRKVIDTDEYVMSIDGVVVLTFEFNRGATIFKSGDPDKVPNAHQFIADYFSTATTARPVGRPPKYLTRQWPRFEIVDGENGSYRIIRVNADGSSMPIADNIRARTPLGQLHDLLTRFGV